MPVAFLCNGELPTVSPCSGRDPGWCCLAQQCSELNGSLPSSCPQKRASMVLFEAPRKMDSGFRGNDATLSSEHSRRYTCASVDDQEPMMAQVGVFNDG